MNLVRFEAVCSFDVSMVGVAIVVRDFLVAQGFQLSAYGGLGRLSKLAERRGHFGVEFDDLVVDGCGIRNFDHSRLDVRSVRSLDWDLLIVGLAEVAPLVAARLADVDYNRWENNESILLARDAGRLRPNARIVGNGLPAPLNEEIIDVSNNPGRYTLRKGYVEFVGQTMWLGPRFFEVVPNADREQVVSSDLIKTEAQGQILKITCGDTLFVDRTTDALQNQLRNLLFNIDATG